MGDRPGVNTDKSKKVGLGWSVSPDTGFPSQDAQSDFSRARRRQASPGSPAASVASLTTST